MHTIADRHGAAHAPPRPPDTDGPAGPARERALPQLGLRGIIAVWAAATLPMAVLAWVVAPAVAHDLTGPGALSRALIVTLTAGWSGSSRW